MELTDFDRHMVAVLFPGIVKNEDKAVQCLGGIKNISQVHSDLNKRLALSFQPDNPYVRKVYSDPTVTAGVLLKVKVKKSKVNNEVKKEVISTSVLGRVNKIYKYEALSDFQYLPVQREKCVQETGDGPLKCILEDILPTGLDSIDFLTKPAHLFVVPAVFTRFEKRIPYSYTEKKYVYRSDVNASEEVHHKLRAERSVHINRFSFNLTEEIPTSPPEHCLEKKRLKLSVNPDMEAEYNTIFEMFERKPIWSTNLIKYHTKLKMVSLKLFLPCVAYFMKDGPWRSSWVKYGYDPRKEPEARKYQILDFRIRHKDGIHSLVKHDKMTPNHKRGDSVRNAPTRLGSLFYLESELTERHVFFKPGMAPPRRQIFYQFCDVNLPEVEELLASEPPPGYMCHERHGWLPPNAGDMVREKMFKYVKQAVLSNYKTEECSDEDFISDEETASTSVSKLKGEMDISE